MRSCTYSYVTTQDNITTPAEAESKRSQGLPYSREGPEIVDVAHEVHVLVDAEGGSSEQEEEAHVRQRVRDELGRRALHRLADLQSTQGRV